jgi:hypothetical protein
MNLAAVKRRLLRNPWLRPVALHLAELGRDLPRSIRFQKIPALQRWSGRPVALDRTAGEYFARHPGRGWEKIVRPGGSYERVRPITCGPKLPPSFDPPQIVAWEDERVIFLEGSRYWGGYGGSIITHDEHLLGEVSPDVWGLERHTLFNKLKLPAVEPLPGLSAIISTAEADRNYSHWMMDLLPRLDLLARAGFGPEKVDRYLVNLGGAPYERETLALAGIPPEKLLPVSAATHYRCEQIVIPSMRPTHWRFSLPAWIPAHLRALVGIPAQPQPTRRLYLTRRTASFRRVLNEDELWPALAGHGFEVFDPGTTTVREQAAAFAQAEWIVSPHSSAMTNLVFCRPGTSVIEIHPADYFDVSFWTAATASHGRYHAFVGERVGTIPLTVIEGRKQDLTLPADIFRTELDILMERANIAAAQ